VPGALIGHNLNLVGVLRGLLDEVVQTNIPINAAQEELLLVGTEGKRADLGAHWNGGNGGPLHFAGSQFVGADFGAYVTLAAVGGGDAGNVLN